MIRCTCGAALTSVESICEICIKPRIPRALFVEDLRIKLANREEEILYWKENAELANTENIELRAERDRLKAVLNPLLNAKVIEGLQEILEAMEAMAEREAPFLKTLLRDANDEVTKLKEALTGILDQVSLSETWVKHCDAYEAARRALEGK